MSEEGGRKVYSPLESAGGTTTIAKPVVSQIAGMAAGEVEGVYLGGSAARRTGGMLDRARSSSKKTREPSKDQGVSVKVGSTEVAVDLTVGFEDGADLPDLTAKVRQRIVNRVENLVGLAVTEVNLNVTDIIFPEEGEREGRGGETADQATGADFAGRDEVEEPDRVPDGEPGTREGGVTRVEPSSRTHTESESGPVPEEEVSVEEVPVEEGEIAKLDTRDGKVEKRKREPKRGGGPRKEQ